MQLKSEEAVAPLILNGLLSPAEFNFLKRDGELQDPSCEWKAFGSRTGGVN